MKTFYDGEIAKSPRIQRLIDHLYENMPVIEASRAVILTKSYQETENEPIIIRRAKAFYKICEELPIIIRPEELIVGSNTIAPRGTQVFPEYSFDWVEDEFETMATRSADPFYISEDTKKALHEAYKYWKGKTTSELATSYMTDETLMAIKHNIFTPGNYFYNGIGHFTVKYDEVLAIGFEGIKAKAQAALDKCQVTDPDYQTRSTFLTAVKISCDAAILYAKRYALLALKEAKECSDPVRQKELLQIAENCAQVPAKPARSFYEACQSFWFVQELLQTESSGHSISPGRFDQYMYPYFKADFEAGKLSREQAQEYIDCIWVKLNDLNKVRDAASAEGFAGYSLFQNLIAGGQDEEGMDATNDLSFMCIEAAMHVPLPQPSFSVRVWNKTPHSFLIKAAKLTRMGTGLPAYYNDEVIIPAMMSRGVTLEDARTYNIIGCVEPAKAGKMDGWHDAAFFNMCRPLELVFSNGMEDGEQVGLRTGELSELRTFEDFFDAYQKQMEYFITLLVNADNSIDVAHAERCPLPFQSCMIDDCIGKGKALQQGGAIYNFTGPQGFGIANVADAMLAVKALVYDQKKVTLEEYKDALDNNFGKGLSIEKCKSIAGAVIQNLKAEGKPVDGDSVTRICESVYNTSITPDKKSRYDALLQMIADVPKYGNDLEEADMMARRVAYVYTKPLNKYYNPRGGIYQAGLYPVSANVPLGRQTGATPDGRLANTPVADGIGPMQGRDVQGPTATANSVSVIDHAIASNGTLFNQKFHPSALAGQEGLEKFVALIRTFFENKGMHMQFNVVSRETLLDAQAHPEKYRNLVVRVAGYSALFTTLSKSLQDDIIKRTVQMF